MKIKWNKELFEVSFPVESTQVSVLKETLAALTGIEVSQMKLLFNGSILKNESDFLSSYKIVNSSTLLLIGTNPAFKVFNDIQSKIVAIDYMIMKFLPQYPFGSMTSPDKHKSDSVVISHSDPSHSILNSTEVSIEKKTKCVIELFIQSILQLDNLSLNSKDDRARRKQIIESINSRLDYLEKK